MKNEDKSYLSKYYKIMVLLLIPILVLIFIYMGIQLVFILRILVLIRLLFMAILPILIGLFIAFFLEPVLCYFDKLGVKRKYSVTVIYLLIMVCLFLLVRFLVPQIIEQFKVFIEEMPIFMDKVMKGSNLNIDKLVSGSNMTAIIVGIGVPVLASVKEAFSILMTLGLGLGAAFYVSLDYAKIKKMILTIPPTKYRGLVKRIFAKSGSVIFKYTKGMMLDTMVLFLLACTVFMFIGFKHFYVYAFIMAITNLIPIIGPWIGGIPVIMFGLLTSVDLGFKAAIAVFVLQYIESSFIQPLILKGAIKLHPLVEMFSLIFLGSIFGIVGMVLSPIVASVVILIYKELTDGIIPD